MWGEAHGKQKCNLEQEGPVLGKKGRMEFWKQIPITQTYQYQELDVEIK